MFISGQISPTAQRAAIHWRKTIGGTDAQRHAFVSAMCSRPISSFNELTADELAALFLIMEDFSDIIKQEL